MQKVLFLDIETAREYEKFGDMPKDGQMAFIKKFGYRVHGYGNNTDKCEYHSMESCYQDIAGLHAEFSKIICIVVGSFIKEDPKDAMSPDMAYLKQIKGDESFILGELFKLIDKFDPDGSAKICAHNGLKFDCPFIGRRTLVNGMLLHPMFDVMFSAPWHVRWIDTSAMWGLTDKSHYTSLITLAYVFKIPSPKTTLDGSMVDAAFREGRIDEIVDYCTDDTFTLMTIYRRMYSMPLLTKKRIVQA